MSERRLIDAERLKRVLVRFEQHLLEFGKVEAAKAVRSTDSLKHWKLSGRPTALQMYCMTSATSMG